MDNIDKGYLSKMWNYLFKSAYDDQCDYFFQCGDDIIFKTKGLFNALIKQLLNNNNIGVTGPANNNPRILTQTFVSRKHMDIFGFYFPEEIYNWCTDDWINYIYQPNFFYPEVSHYCSNEGGKPRYSIDNEEIFTQEKWVLLHKKTIKIVDLYKPKLINYIESNLHISPE